VDAGAYVELLDVRWEEEKAEEAETGRAGRKERLIHGERYGYSDSSTGNEMKRFIFVPTARL
jgi:hypothetical protein